ncbi:DNA ligase D [Asticcacaulis taihuensis]|uniref:DNA ligase (ATP) n=1 Tax=Asticcacaulis taihuensis TaxID=260084 RepID=A0A1G4T9G1_9CAUL|nr:DNA ligase D [Asticcacaulis taihuensis]SCW78008.1 bifunctional non-homologous end joining protein LigD [Asticcacaulis taihuensis]
MADNLEKYRQKRDFKVTAEPEGIVRKTSGHRYLIQKHAASRLHYDFRLELDGTLKSWAVTRGPSLDPADKRLAVEVEDHPVDYGRFEGTIPQGHYGGGTVMLWDEGDWEPIGDPHEGLKKGDFKFRLNGKRLQGEWVLVRMKPRPQDKGRNNWLLIKHHDGREVEGDDDHILTDNMTSIVSGRTMEEIAAGEGGGKVWKSSHAEKTAPTKKAGKTPALKFIEPELATLADTIPTGKNWLHEVKFDGYRTFAYIEDGSVRMMTRKGLDWTPKFQALADRLEGLGVKSAIIDGEIVALNAEGRSSFTALKNTLSAGKSADLQYYVFDLLYLDGEDLRGLPLLERKARLAGLLKGKDFAGRINFSEHFFEADKGFLNKICDMEMEGLICKRADAPYTSGRAKSWLKVKCHKRQEFVIGGFSEPTHAERGIGAILLGYYEEEKFIYAGKCGTGFDRDTSVALRKALDKLEVTKSQYDDKLPADARRGAQYVTPKLVCEIEFTEWTDDGRLRHPSFQGLREDKPAEEVGRDRALHVTKEVMEADPPLAPKTKSKSAEAEVAGIRISHPNRVIFPALGVTKLQLAEYYDRIADRMLPYIINRPISMLRCPEGLSPENKAETCFFQRHLGKGEMKHIYDTGVKVKGRDEDYIMIRDRAGLITMIQWGVIEIHPWGAMADAPDKPNQIIFDLDPDPETPWDNVIEGVREVKTRLDEFGLKAFLKTTGGKGLHVVVPLTPKYTWATVKPFTRAIAQSMAHDYPDRYIAMASKAARKGKIFVDYLRNDLTATAVAPYSVRAREAAGVATPLFWDELSVKLKPSGYNIGTIAERLAQLKSDPWADFLTTRQTISEDILTALRIDIHN